MIIKAPKKTTTLSSIREYSQLNVSLFFYRPILKIKGSFAKKRKKI
jgi:hypothetical protein